MSVSASLTSQFTVDTVSTRFLKPQHERLVAVAQRASAMVHESGVSVSGFARTRVFGWGGPSQPAAFEARPLRVWRFCRKLPRCVKLLQHFQ